MKNRDKTNVLLFCLAMTLAAGCATVSRPAGQAGPGGHIELQEFCKKYNYHFSANTLDDIIRIYTADSEIRLLFGSSVAYVNGNIMNLQAAPVYSRGTILIPRQMESIVGSKGVIGFKSPFRLSTVIIDAGHGGKDPGAISSSGLKEKGINLQVAKYLKDELEKRGYKVRLTRARDEFLSLQQRVDLAKKYDADLFVSIHSNASRSRSLNGMEVYYLTPSRLDSQNRAVSLAKDTSCFVGNVPFAARAILWDMTLTKNHSLSVETANQMYNTLKKLGFKVKQPRPAPYYVLRCAYVPAVLVEVGYLTNRYEEKVLRKNYYQKQIAESVALGIVELNRRYGTDHRQQTADGRP